MPTDSTPLGAADTETLHSLKAGDEGAFTLLVQQHHRHLVYAAQKYVRDPGTAEDVAQETWMGFLDSLDRFEGRCSLKTWLFRILFNKARTRASRDGKLVPFSSLAADEGSGAWSSVDPSYFKSSDDPVEPGHWTSQPPAWKTDPERIVEDKEALEIVRQAIDNLPPAQGTVALLRDVHGLSSQEVCNALGITETNQRVLLHRARTTVRRGLSERYGTGI